MEPGRPAGPDVLAGSADDTPRRRWPTWLVGLAVAGAALTIARPDLSLHADRDIPRPEPSRSADRVPRNSLDGVDWPVRGDLATDHDFVRAGLNRVRQERAEVTRLYFAGRLSDGSRLMLAGTDVNRGVVATSVHALHVPAGVPVEGAQVSEAPALVDPQQVLAWAARGEDGVVRVVALTRPGPVRLQVSAHVVFHPSDGSPERRWTDLPVTDGVAIADLGREVDPIVSIRAQGPGVFTLPLVVRVIPRVPGAPVLAVAGTGSRDYSGPSPTSLSRALRAQAGFVADLDSADLRVLWSGAPTRQRSLALVLVTRADGRRLQAVVAQQGDAGYPAGVRALADDAPSRLPWLLEPFSAQDATLLLCPTGDGSIIYRRDGRPARTLQIGTDGVVALAEPAPSPPSSGGADVTVLDTTGRILLRTILPRTGFDDPLALD